ncbi:MAG: D-hexose-6-phosphate mutarotase [Gammaproteobacteria bacterium]
MNPEQLNATHGIADTLCFVTGNGGLPLIDIDNGRARALISPYAGQVLSFLPAGEPEDLLFLSQHAYFQPGKAIKGGIPVCWPWFGPDPEGGGRPAHGFVRNRDWQVLGTTMQEDGTTSVRLGITPDEEIRALWSHPFALTLEIIVGRSLELALCSFNPDTVPLTITQGLHSYFRVGDVSRARVLGLEGKSYIDKIDGAAVKTQEGPVTIDGEVDRIYTGADHDLVIDDPVFGRRIRIAAEGSASAVVWNPWATTAAAMADLGDDEYTGMLCVETTNAGPDAVQVIPGENYRLAARYTIERD